MSSVQQDLWKALLAEQTRRFEQAGYKDISNITNVESFNGTLQELATRYSRKNVSKFIAKLLPTINHLKSFTEAISSVTQADTAATIVWGGLQAVLECGCRYATVLEEIFDLIIELNNALPIFDNYMALFPDKPSIQWPLRDMYDDYINFCITAVKHLKKRTLYNLLSNLWTSSLLTTLRKSKASMMKHRSQFDREIELADREAQRLRHIEVIKMLSTPTDVISNRTSVKAEVAFPVSTVTQPRNLNFVGRENILVQIHQHATSELPDVPLGPSCLLLHGLGGMGKTQVALEYTYLHKNTYDAIFWLRAETPSELSYTYSRIARKVGTANSPVSPLASASKGDVVEPNMDRMIEEARDWLEGTNRKWLLVFDNVDSWKSIAYYWPTNLKSRGAVIITTQRPDWVQITESCICIPLPPLGLEDGAKLLQNHISPLQQEPSETNNEVAQQISNLVGGLPLSLATIGGYINQCQCSLTDFLEVYQKSSTMWAVNGGTAVWQYEKTLETVFDVALRELPKDAQDLINILAFLNPDAIPEEMLIRTHNDGTLESIGLWPRDHFMEMIHGLRHRQLVHKTVDQEANCITLHRSLQWSLLHKLSQDPLRRTEAFNQAFLLVRKAFPPRSSIQMPDSSKYAVIEKYLPQVFNLRDHAMKLEPSLVLTIDFATLLVDSGVYLWERSLTQEGNLVLRSSEKILDDISADPLNLLRADIHEILAAINQRVGISQSEEGLYRKQRVLDIRKARIESKAPENITKDDEQKLANGYSGVGVALMYRGEFGEAERLFDKCLEMQRGWTSETETPFQYAKLYLNKGLTRIYQNDSLNGVALVTSAAEMIDKCMGSTSGMTLFYKFVLAKVLARAGYSRESLSLHEAVLSSTEALNGESNTNTVLCYIETAMGQLQFEHINNAEENITKALRNAEKVNLSAEHIAKAQFILAKVLHAKGERQEGDQIEQTAVRFRDKMLEEYSDLLTPDLNSEIAIFDQIAFMPLPRKNCNNK